jgi:hypothetical protein
MKVQKLRRPKKEKSPLSLLNLFNVEMSCSAGVVNSSLLKDTHSLTHIYLRHPVWKYKNTEALAKMEFLELLSFETHTHSNKYIARPGTIRSLFLWTIVLALRGEPQHSSVLLHHWPRRR